MVKIKREGQNLVLEVQGWDKLWALKSRLEVPCSKIRGVRADPTVAHGWWKGLRAPGTHVPGVITAGTFYHHGKCIFWDVKDPEKTIVIELADDRYDQLIIEVEDPPAEVQRIREAISSRRPASGERQM